MMKLVYLLPVLLTACGPRASSPAEDTNCPRCDQYVPLYEADLDAIRAETSPFYNADAPINSVEDLYRLKIFFPDPTTGTRVALPPVGIHLFPGSAVTIVPYADGDDSVVSGTTVRGDIEVAKLFAPGEI